MNCPFSGKPCSYPQVYHITEVDEKGTVSSLDMCHFCAKTFLDKEYFAEEQEAPIVAQTPMSSVPAPPEEKKYIETPEELASFFSNIPQLFQPLGVVQNSLIPTLTPCPVCGATKSDINSYNGKMGCPSCYAHWKEIPHILENYHHSTKHVGKIPKSLMKAKTREELLSLMKMAIDEENYEYANELKKQIKTMDDASSPQ